MDMMWIGFIVFMVVYAVGTVWAITLYRKYYEYDVWDEYSVAFIASVIPILGAYMMIGAHYFTKDGMGYPKENKDV